MAGEVIELLLSVACPFFSEVLDITWSQSYTTVASLLPIVETADGKGDTEHLGGAGGK